MKRSTQILAGAILLGSAVLIGGCIVSDQLSTITIHPDGSAEVVIARMNVHSTEAGIKQADELRRYQEEFNTQTGPDHRRIVDAGGQIDESRWIRGEAPFANVIVARLPTAEALQRYFTFKGEKGETLVTARFVSEGTQRKLSLLVTLPPEEQAETASQPASGDLRIGQANGLSETRIAVTGGKIVEARGFTIAGDKQSALLEPSAIEQLAREQREFEIYLAWEIEP